MAREEQSMKIEARKKNQTFNYYLEPLALAEDVSKLTKYK